MPTAVLDLDVRCLPRLESGFERYSHALVLFRLAGRPVGSAVLDVRAGRLDQAALRDAAAEATALAARERWLHHYLGMRAGIESAAGAPRATVAVCTRDRPDDLRRCIEALVRLPDDGQELLVIDNAPSTDQSERVVADYPGVRYVREERPGLDVARNRALRAARHEVVAFCDDDAAPDANWLRALLGNFDDPSVLCVTGLTMPIELETDAQEWFERYSPFGRGFRRVVFDVATHNPLHTGPIGAGANMAVRRDALRLVGPFDEALDAGTPTRSGGDHEMFSRILAAGYRIVYEPSALSWHRHRRTWQELRATLYGYGVGVYATWTRRLLVERQLGVLAIAWSWFRHGQAPAIARSLLRRPGRAPRDLLFAELRGCLAGPGLYLASRRSIRSSGARP